MPQIVPTILTNKISELEEKLGKLQGLVKSVHLDIIDGRFVANKTISLNDLKKVKILKNFKLGLHLMVVNPLALIKKAAAIKAEKLIAHVEALKNQQTFVQEVIKQGIKPGLACDLETSWEKIDNDLLALLDVVLVMTVKAGWGGQSFEKKRLKELRKLNELRKRKGFSFKIGVDGGLNEETIKACLEAGADILAVGGTIWKSQDIKKKIEKLKRLI